jgi:hypothetical protein
MLEISFQVCDDKYRLEATNYGCDIFLNDAYWGTIESEEEDKSKNYWIGKAIEDIIYSRYQLQGN